MQFCNACDRAARLITITLIGFLVTLISIQETFAEKRPNVLFLMADDLRPELGCYGSSALTPNLDGLAKRGVQFNRAYCQQSLCNPSRSSMLTGLRPDTLHLWNNSIHFRERIPAIVTLPQHFKSNGYVTRNVGKIFHNWHTKEHGDPVSWSAPEFLHYANHGEDVPQVDGERPKNFSTAPNCARCDVRDEAYYDGRVADEAVRVLGEIKDRPFFLAVGFWKPHVPFNAPLHYWEKVDQKTLPKLDPRRPSNAPEIAFHDSRELRGVPPKQLDFTAEQAAEMRHGYFANTNYMDTQLGKVLAALDKHGLTSSTVIVFCGDHGFHLGEHSLWGKTSCFELDAHVPLLVIPPGAKQAGAKTDALVELVDLFPTVCDLCALPPPLGLQGKSLVPILENPRVTVKPAAFSQHPRPAYFDRTEKGVPDAMGYSVRTDRVRYTEWRDWETGKIVGRELYDHVRDPAETENVIQSPADPTALDEAEKLLRDMFSTAIPPVRR